MPLLIANASAIELLVPALAVIAGVVVGGLLPDLLAQRRSAQAKYDKAISAVARMQSTRQGVPVSMPAELVKARTPQELASIEQSLSIDNVRQFMAAAAEARAALAELHPFSPDLRSYWNKFEIPDTEMDGLVDVLMTRRRRPTKRHAALSSDRDGTAR
jgi:hypothetical protein